eukprot:c5172_g1_i1 orf=112-1059(+)
MSATKFNMSNPAVKRILQEVKEMQTNPSDDYTSLPLEDNIFEWQFAIRGPQDSEFEGGIYHGRIQLPPEYPFKPPSFMLLTPNGRFETQTKICLSISQYHPEHWQPSWSVRTALVALIAFMPTKGNGAIGSLEFTKEERKALALKSVEAPPKYGSEERQKLIDEIHEQMIRKTGAVQTSQEADSEALVANRETPHKTDNEALVANTETPHKTDNEALVANTETPHKTDNVEMSPAPTLNGAQGSEHAPPVETANVEVPVVEPKPTIANPPARLTRRPQASDDQFLTLLAIGLVVALAALLMKKFYYSFSWISFKQ